MIRIGNQTSFAASAPTVPFAYALAQGFNAFEWFPDKHGEAGWIESDFPASLRTELRDAARAAGMSLSVHARFDANPLTAEGPSLIYKDLELAADLGARLLNLHLFETAGLAAFVRSILPLARRAAEAGIGLAIENTPMHSPEDFSALFSALRKLDGCGHVGMCFDLGHANLCSSTQNRYLEFLDRLDPLVPIIHVHLHENWGDTDSHLPLFTGPAGRDASGIRGLLRRLRHRAFSGSFILEQWPDPPSLLTQARDRLLAMLDEAGRDPSGCGSQSPGDGQSRRGKPDTGPEKKREEAAVVAFENSPGSGRQESAQSDPWNDVPGLVDELAEANRRNASWREKLDAVREILGRKGEALSEVDLVDTAIFLRFLGTGALACSEDGRHFRPSHHARIAAGIREQLARFKSGPQVLAAREIYPWLPSSGPAFQRAEPLTRIRDIAHRDDIPPDLKRELKVSLQNKLHRCAGPEDLVVSRGFLRRFTEPGSNYPPEFVREYGAFHAELEEFFNASSLDRRLNSLLARANGTRACLIRAFLDRKGGTRLTEQLSTLESLVALREECVHSATLQPGEPDFLLADIGLEDFAFSLVSAAANNLEAEVNPGPEGGRDGRDRGMNAEQAAWLSRTLSLTVANLRLSQVQPDESAALESELEAWNSGLDLSDRDQCLRLKASADRARRLAESHSRQLLALFGRRAEKLGRALRVAEHSIKAYGEAAIRRHLTFQVSKLASSLLRFLRGRLGLPPWDVVVTGRAVGRLERAQSIADVSIQKREPVIALLERAQGDEEIPDGVAGIVLAHDLPHLSHLAVRARQAGVVLVTWEEGALEGGLAALEGKNVFVNAQGDGVEWGEWTGPARPRVHRAPAEIPDVSITAGRTWVGLDELAPGCGGAKAEGARKLALIARVGGAGYRTPGGLVVPFGVMEGALRAAPAGYEEYERRCRAIESAPPSSFEDATRPLRDLIQSLPVPVEIQVAVERAFGRKERVMVRSSSNCEDLGGLAGAGLYESVANVAADGINEAICRVWASLWTSRATLSRKQAGIAHARARMAVLIQPMVVAEFSFILHTSNPIRPRPEEAYVEVAAGLGEVLASGAARGTPFRLACNKETGRMETLAFGSFSQALAVSSSGELAWRTVDYSRVVLSREAGARERLGRRLGALASFVERAWGGPQDVEGATVGEEIYLMQARPQMGIQPQ